MARPAHAGDARRPGSDGGAVRTPPPSGRLPTRADPPDRVLAECAGGRSPLRPRPVCPWGGRRRTELLVSACPCRSGGAIRSDTFSPKGLAPRPAVRANDDPGLTGPSWPKFNTGTGGEFVTPTYAACCRAANREQRVRETGVPDHQSSTRTH